jgi:hypothetical protein
LSSRPIFCDEAIPEHLEAVRKLPRYRRFRLPDGDAKRSPYHLDEGQKRRLLAVRRAAAGKDEGSGLGNALLELVDEARLADTGLARDIDDAKSRARLRQKPLQPPEFAIATDVGREAAAQGNFETHRASTQRIQLKYPLRLRLAFDLARAGKVALHHAFDETVRCFAQQDGCGLGKLLQARGEIGRVAERGGASAVLSVDLPHHCRACVDADPKLGPHAMDGFDLRRSCGEPLLDQESGATGAEWRVFHRLRHAEQGHDAVPGEARYATAMLLDRLAQKLGDRLHKRVGRFFSRSFGKGGKSNEVRKQHGNLAALALGSTARFIARHRPSEASWPNLWLAIRHILSAFDNFLNNNRVPEFWYYYSHPGLEASTHDSLKIAR